MPDETDTSAAAEQPTPAPADQPASGDRLQRMLAYAWHRFNGYDKESGALKRRYRRIRITIIVLSWITTLLAVLSGFASGTDKERFNNLLVALPLISTGLLAYAVRFESGLGWVGFRVAAEEIRRGIYSLRVRSWLGSITAEDLKTLDALVRETSATLEKMGVTTPIMNQELLLDVGTVKPAWVDVKDDDGYAALSIQEYIAWRVIPQTNWYRKRVKQDYWRTRIFRVAILIIGGLGALLAHLGLAEFVAVTVAGVTALVAMLGLLQYEVNYGNFMRTILKLEDNLRGFAVDLGIGPLKPDQLTDLEKQRIRQFVKAVEDTFADERELWKYSVLQSQEATEGALAQMVSTYRTSDFDPNQLLDLEQEDEEGIDTPDDLEE